MNFTNVLPLGVVVFASAALLSCAAHPDKISGSQQAFKTEQQEVRIAILPAGPATPNPYLQSSVTVNTETATNFQAALTAMQNKNWNQAEQLLQALALANPGLSGVALNLGIVYRSKGELEKATEQFNRAIQINPKNLDAYNQLAILKREAGQFSEAENLYKQALHVWPYHRDSHRNIAILYELYLGQPEQALPHYIAYQQLSSEPDKQVASWIADLQRRVNNAKPAPAANEKSEQTTEVK